MLTRSEAELIARRYLDEKMAREKPTPIAIQPGFTFETSKGWVFFYDSTRYIETGNPFDALGDDPFLVDRASGRVAVLGGDDLTNAEAWKIRRSRLVRGEEANQLVDGIGDSRVRALVRYGLTTIIMNTARSIGSEPKAEVDLLVFAEALRAMGTNHAALQRIVTGDPSSMEWWPEGEDGP